MVSAMATLDFWYDFASTYSYLSAMRIEPLASAASVEVCWRPFLLGPIFRAQGWNNSPFNLYPAKGRHMWRDMERQSEDLGLPQFSPPRQFPANSLLSSRTALALPEKAVARFSRAVFAAEFVEARDIADRGVLAEILKGLGHDAEAVLARANEPAVKDKLRAETEEATGLGIFGAPTFVTGGGELFWGNDRLEQALAWSRK